MPYALGANLAISRRAYEVVGGWDASVAYGTDVDLCLRVQMAGFSLGWAPDAVVAYRHRHRWYQLMVQSFRWGRADSSLSRRHTDYLGSQERKVRVRGAIRRVMAREDSVTRLCAFGAGRALGLLR